MNEFAEKMARLIMSLLFVVAVVAALTIICALFALCKWLLGM